MTPEEKQNIFDLIENRITAEEFLRRWGAARSEASKLGLGILEKAYRTKAAGDVSFGLYLAFHFGVTAEYFDVLCKLADEEWHKSHEDVVWALDGLRDKRAIDVFVRAALKLHPYLAYDDTRALASKALYALANLADPDADERLRWLSQSDDPVVKEEAVRQLQYRGLTRSHE